MNGADQARRCRRPERPPGPSLETIAARLDRKRVNRTLRRIKERLRERWHDNRHETADWLGRVINGWLNHYAVPGSGRYPERFVLLCKRLL